MACRIHSIRSTLGTLVLAAGSGFAGAADLPEPVKKLTGSSEETARSVMTQQGYALRNQKTSWGRDYRFWWSDKRRQCVRLMSLAGRVAQVEAKEESDCKPAAVAAASAPTTPGTSFDYMTLPGQPRDVAEQRLVRAGFRAVEVDMSKGDTIYSSWTDGRLCLSATIVGGRFERVDEMSKQGCYLK